MQKLSRTSLGKNNKSCWIFHSESSKIESAFFWFFYDFIRILQDSANHNHYWSYSFSRRSPKLGGTWHICPQFTQNSSDRNLATQLGPSPWPVAVRPNPARPAASSAGKSVGEVRELTYSSIAAEVAAVASPVGSHGGGDRGEPLCSLLRRSTGQCGATGWRIRWRLERGGVNRSR
jgi:hypothetical protein